MSSGLRRRDLFRMLAGAGVCAGARLIGAPDFHTESTQVLIPFVALDQHDHLIDGLAAEDFRLLADGKEQPINFVVVEDGPASIVLVLDTSGSMRKAVAGMQEVARRILRSADVNDEFAVMEFSDRTRMTVDFTTGGAQVEDRIKQIAAEGPTPLADAILHALEAAKRVQRRRRALIVVSDGRDNHSRHVPGEVMRAAIESDVRVYAIELYPPMGEAFVSPTLLELLAHNTGGRYLPTMNRNQIPSLIERIDIHRNYVLGFTPPANHRDGRNHAVDLRLKERKRRGRARLFWKERYRVPLVL